VIVPSWVAIASAACSHTRLRHRGRVGVGGLGTLVTGSVLFSLGLAPVFTLATDMTVGTAPPERVEAAAAVSETSSDLGGALGIAILGSIGREVYRSAMAAADISGLTPEAGRAARDTLSGAVAAAERLPEQLGLRLVDAARDAFVYGFEVTAAVSALVAIVLALVAGVLLRKVQAIPSPTSRHRSGTSAVRSPVARSWKEHSRDET